MKTLYFAIIAGIGIAILVFTSIFYITTKDACRDLGGALIDLNVCKIIRSSGVSPQCDPGPVLGDGYCYKNGMKIIVSETLED